MGNFVALTNNFTIMKKILFLLAMLPMMVFTACSSDDDVDVTKELVVGTWNVTWAEIDGEETDVPNGFITIDLKSNGNYNVYFLGDRYTGTWELDGNTVIGVTPDPITEYYKFVELNGNNATIDYSNSTGDKYKFKATKR